MAAAGNASEEEVPAYVPKNVITRSLGPHPTVSVDVEGPFPLQSGDRFLLCSDGLTGPLQPDLIGAVLNSLPLEEAAQTLVDLANLSGGPDNITAVAVEVSDTGKLGLRAAPEEPHEPLRVIQQRRKSNLRMASWLIMFLSGAWAAVMLAMGHLPLVGAGLCACSSRFDDNADDSSG
jgi:serine/threonine protein phosphatase PrpC